MNKKKFGLGLAMLAFGFLAITGCNKEKEPTVDPTPVDPTPVEPEPTAVEISNVLSLTTGTEACVEGVVYQTTSEGYFVADTTGAIYVKDAKNTFVVGDTVKVNATYRVLSEQPTIVVKTTDTVTKSGTGTPIEPTSSSIAKINAMNKSTIDNYAKYLTVVGTLTDNEALTYYTLTDSDSNSINITKGDNSIVNFVGKRVEISVVVAKYDSVDSKWVCNFGGTNKVSEKPFTLTEVKPEIEKTIENKMPTVVYGNYNTKLPIDFDNLGATITWASNNESVISVDENGKLIINYKIEEDVDVTLSATITVAEETETLNYTVTAKAIEQESLKDVMMNFDYYLYGDFVKFSGIVVAKVQNQSGTLNGLVLAHSLDSSDKEYRVQYDLPYGCEEYNNVEIGQTVTVFGQVRNSKYERFTVLGYTETTQVIDTVETTVATLYGFEVNADEKQNVSYTDDDVVLVVDSVEDYLELAANWNTMYVGRLIKIVNPYAMWTVTSEFKRTTQTGIILTLDATTYADAYEMQMNGITTNKAGEEIAKNRLAIISEYNDTVLGTSIWHDDTLFDIAYRTDDGLSTEYKVSIYAIPTYFNQDGNGSSLLCIPSFDCVVPTETDVALTIALGSKVPTSIDVETVELPATYKGQNIKWTVLDGQESYVSFADATGDVVVATVVRSETENINVTFVATVDETSVEFNSVLLKNAPLEISELAAMEKGSGLNVQGYVIGIAVGHGGSAVSNGVLVSDGTKTMIVTNCKAFTYGTAKEADAETVKIGDTVIQVGDYIKFSGAEVVAAGQKFSAKGATIIAESHKDLDASFNKTSEEDMVVIDSNEDMIAYMAQFTCGSAAISDYTKLVKVVGTEENPVYVGANNVTYMMGLFYATPDENGKVTAVPSYTVQSMNTSKVGMFLVKPLNAVNTYGIDWLILNTPVNKQDANSDYGMNMTATSANSPAIPLVGELYFYYEYVGSAAYPFVYMNPVYGTNCVHAVNEAETAKELILKGFPTEVRSEQEYEISLANNSLITDIAVTSDNVEILNPSLNETVKCGKITENTDVNLTITYKLEGIEQTVTITVTCKPSAVTTYELVTDSTKLKAGQKIIFVYGNNETVAIGKTDGTSTTVTLKDGKATFVDDTVELFTLVTGTVEGTFGFQYGSSDTNKLINATSASKGTGYTSSAISKTSSWTIKITDGTASIINNGDTKYCLHYATASGVALIRRQAASKDEHNIAIYVQVVTEL